MHCNSQRKKKYRTHLCNNAKAYRCSNGLGPEYAKYVMCSEGHSEGNCSTPQKWLKQLLKFIPQYRLMPALTCGHDCHQYSKKSETVKIFGNLPCSQLLREVPTSAFTCITPAHYTKCMHTRDFICFTQMK